MCLLSELTVHTFVPWIRLNTLVIEEPDCAEVSGNVSVLGSDGYLGGRPCILASRAMAIPLHVENASRVVSNDIGVYTSI
jgi:hypothetical protein